MATDSFGPSALATPANAITIVRLAATPILLGVILATERTGGWPAFGLWFVLAGTDGLDGWVARRQGTTSSGAFLDPLADKFLVLGAMLALVVNRVLWWVPVSLIAMREVAISAYRWSLARQGVSVPARPLAKVKTWVQDIAVGLALWPWAALHRTRLTEIVLWAAVVLTLFTGAQYLLDGRERGSL